MLEFRTGREKPVGDREAGEHERRREFIARIAAHHEIGKAHRQRHPERNLGVAQIGRRHVERQKLRAWIGSAEQALEHAAALLRRLLCECAPVKVVSPSKRCFHLHHGRTVRLKRAHRISPERILLGRYDRRHGQRTPVGMRHDVGAVHQVCRHQILGVLVRGIHQKKSIRALRNAGDGMVKVRHRHIFILLRPYVYEHRIRIEARDA